MGGIVKRQIEVGADSCLLGFGGRQYVKSGVFDATSLRSGTGGTDEVQAVTISGAPTGGTFTLTFRGQTTAGIAYNAAVATVQSALEALSTIDDGDVHVTGSAGGPYSVHFINDLGHQDVDLMAADGSGLTGGTTPSVAVTETTKGSDSGFDPRILLGSPSFPGTIVRKTGTSPDKLVEYDGTGDIFGIVDGIEEFITNTSAGDRDVAVYAGPGCSFDASKIKNYATYKTAFDTWAASRGNTVENNA